MSGIIVAVIAGGLAGTVLGVLVGFFCAIYLDEDSF